MSTITKSAVLSKEAPAPSPLMSQGVICNGMVYCSGSLGIDPKTNEFVEGDTQALRNLENVLRAAGSDLSRVVKVNIFLSSMNHYTKMNEAYGKIFHHDVKPCRTCVPVPELPLGAELEIELTAHL
ncbi:hypothetical protein FE257_009845 [Aspergillus nanangensis]|uniref:Uncharacterized protein n=1 Tax=Aspergillus nanangensis TaxID=2582783 RepID=A0AAD4CWD2_ASPNN|nr:hypothetical protein FE257_009845 [Aspergillus nanangensis]